MRRLGMALGLMAALTCNAAAQRAPVFDVAAALDRLSESVVAFYARAQSIICDETVSLQQLGFDLMSDASPPRRLLYELRVAWEPPPDGGSPEATVLRTLVRVNNRAPREKDHDACLDPKAVSPEPLAMFLPASQQDYTFTAAGRGKVDGRQALMIDYRSRETGKVTATRKDDCFSISIPGRTAGRVWMDESTGDVLRLDERLTGMVDVTLPPDPKHRGLTDRITVERLDSSIVYRRVEFSDPDESVMLPASKMSLSVIRNSGAPRLRTTQSFRNYRRFITGGRIVQ